MSKNMTENQPLNAAYDHTGFVTQDIEASASFWCRAFGLTATDPIERGAPWVEGMTGVIGARLRIMHLTAPGIHLEFISFLAPKGGDKPPEATALATGHVCLRVPDPAAALERLFALGGQPEGRVTEITEGGLAGRHGVYLRDPGGVLIELLEDPSLTEISG
ncbi:VOC family protein [Paracoccus sp. SCSIO 75233]|uniref:VOC family protein n=1 Tax=Paracoccus sp. SCSIO 75233 TaxID=3017782 RepID=UPI0022F0A330|nr:VOC family protein [Paracoccus sp. SCSIO 75233]WBU52032.1 VOC family protein [Paracoccus sp. SCSIO 75233]